MPDKEKKKWIRELKSRNDVPEEVLNQLESVETKGEAKRIWKEHQKKTARKGEWREGKE